MAKISNYNDKIESKIALTLLCDMIKDNDIATSDDFRRFLIENGEYAGLDVEYCYTVVADKNKMLLTLNDFFELLEIVLVDLSTNTKILKLLYYLDDLQSVIHSIKRQARLNKLMEILE